jgi:hypothetical protein
MSTKTTFKRIALVAVAALGFGMLSVVPSTAVPQADTLTASALTASAIPGGTASVTLTHTYLSTGTGDTVTATVSIVSMPAGNTALPVLASVTTNDTGSPVKAISGLTASTGSVAASTAVRGDYTLSLTSLKVGTYVFSVTPQSGSKASALTLTYTIGDTATAPTAASSRVYMQAGAGKGNNAAFAEGLALDGSIYGTLKANSSTTPAAVRTALGTHIATQDADTTNNVSTLTVAGGLATTGTIVANFGVILGNGDTITASTISGALQCDQASGQAGCTTQYAPSASTYFNAAGYPVTATVTGPGYLTYLSATVGGSKGKTYTEISTDGDVNYLQKSFFLVSDGSLGTSTITFTQGGVTLATRTVNFTGPLASLSVARAATFGGSSFPVATNTGAYVVTAKDANGNALPSTVVYAFSGTAATGTINTSVTTGATGTASFDFVGLAAGTTAITFGNASTAATSTITATAAAEVTGSTATTVTFTTDKTDYQPGEKVTLTITAKDANGKPVADGARVLLATITSNVAIGTVALSTTTTLLNGVATQTFFAPATTGSFTISGTKGAAALADPVSVTATVTNDVAQAAVDAAAEAIDAANAATDAANAAAEAADAATAAAQDAADAVAALSVSVAAMIDALKKQITSLTNLVIKIQKKVKA